MIQQQPRQSNDTSVQNTPGKPKPTLSEIANAHRKDQAGVQEKYGEAISKEERCKVIGQAMMEKATTDPKGKEHLAPYLEHDGFPDDTNECLYIFEAERRARTPEFDITTLPSIALAGVLKRGLQQKEEKSEKSEKIKIDTKEVKKSAADIVKTETYETLVASLEGKPNIEKIRTLLTSENADKVPEAERVKLQAFSTIISLAQTPQDRQIITQKINGLDFTKLPDPVSFARAFIFDSPDSQIKTGVSEATQQAIAAKLGISLPKQSPKTGGDANDAFERGAEETYIDENGEVKKRSVPLKKGHKVPFAGGELGLDEEGNRTAWIKTQIGVFETELPENPTDQYMGNVIRSVQLRAKLHESNVAHLFFTDVDVLEFGSGKIQIDPAHFAVTERFLNIVVRNQALAGNNLLSQPDLDKIPYLLQFHNRKGDYGIADINPEQTQADYRAQGIIDKSGALNWERFNNLVTANRSNLYSESNFKANLAA